jgi:hypothetical protein
MRINWVESGEGYFPLVSGGMDNRIASEKATLERFAKIGIGPGRAFDAATLDPAIREAIEAGVKDGNEKLQTAIAKTTSSVDLFGTREFLGAAM